MITGKVVIISGAGGGLGQTVSRVFHRQGASVVLIGSRLNGVQALADKLGDRALPLTANLIDPAEAEYAAQSTLDHFGRIDILLNLAGGFTGGQPVNESPANELDKMLNLNLRTTYNLSKAAVKPMIAQKWGRIINIGSRDAFKGRANFSAYAMSKAAVLRLTESMAAEVQKYGITVNAVLPGTIDTEANRRSMPNADFDKWVKPEIIAETLLFLTSGDTAINGAAIPVYGQT